MHATPYVLLGHVNENASAVECTFFMRSKYRAVSGSPERRHRYENATSVEPEASRGAAKQSSGGRCMCCVCFGGWFGLQKLRLTKEEQCALTQVASHPCSACFSCSSFEISLATMIPTFTGDADNGTPSIALNVKARARLRRQLL